MIKIPPPIIALIAAFTMWLLSGYLALYHLDIPYNKLLAAVIAVIGISIDLTAIWSFRKAKTTVNPLTPNRSSAVVTGGLYRYSRNPMYVGLLLLLIAWGIYLQTLSVWLVPPLFVWVITALQIVPEERALTSTFGDEYVKYMNTVRRWL